MILSRRRRFDVVLLGAVVLASGAAAVIGGVAGDTERVTGMWVGASLEPDGRAAVTEVIDYDFGLAQEKHGIFRSIPGLSTDDPVQVASASAPDAIASKAPVLMDGERGIELRIGDAATTVTGRHRYQIDYSHPGLLRGGLLQWDAVGTRWRVAVDQSEVHVVAPWAFTGLSCSKGTTGTTGGCELTQPEPGHLVAEVGRLASGEGITIEADRGEPLASAPVLPAPPLTAPPDPGAGLARPAGAAAVASLAGAAAASRLVRRRGRERVGTGGVADAAWADGSTSEVLLDADELAGMATTEFAPPKGLRAPMGGIILAEQVRPEHRVAWLIEAAISGAVDLVEEDGEAVRLVRGEGDDPDAAGPLDEMFSGRSQLTLGAYDPSFATGWASVGEQLAAWQAQSGLWDPAGDRRKIGVRVVGVLVAVIGVIGVAVAAALASRWGEGWLALVAASAIVAGAGAAAAIRAWELRVRTPEGSGLWLRVESFRRFLASSEASHAEEAARRGVLREYTAWAVAVGEIDRWERAVSSSSAIPAQAGLGYVHMAPLLLVNSQASTTAPSSSGGGGGFGGGSVGGGGGGGGGGSW